MISEACNFVGISRRRLSKQDEIDLAERIKSGDRDAADTLARCNYAWTVRSACKAARRSGVNIDDAQWITHNALYRAVGIFDPSKGRFTTLLKKMIDNECRNNLFRFKSPLHVPSSVEECIRRCDDPNLSQSKRDSAAETYRITLLALGAKSAEDYDAVSEDEYIEPDPRMVDIRREIESLPERYRIVMEGRYPKFGDRKKLREVASMLGITKERVRQVESRAIEIVKRRLTNPVS